MRDLFGQYGLVVGVFLHKTDRVNLVINACASDIGQIGLCTRQTSQRKSTRTLKWSIPLQTHGAHFAKEFLAVVHFTASLAGEEQAQAACSTLSGTVCNVRGASQRPKTKLLQPNLVHTFDLN